MAADGMLLARNTMQRLFLDTIAQHLQSHGVTEPWDEIWWSASHRGYYIHVAAKNTIYYLSHRQFLMIREALLNKDEVEPVIK